MDPSTHFLPVIWTSTLLGLCTPLFALILHILVYRLFPKLIPYPRQKLALLVILGAVLLSVLGAITLHLGPDHIIHTFVLGLMLGYSYFHFFNMSETARRIRILVEYVAKIPPHQTQDYDTDTIFANRITRMHEHGLIDEAQAGRLTAHSGPMLWASHLILFWRRLFF